MVIGRASSTWRSRDVMSGMLRDGDEGWKQNAEGRGLVRHAPRPGTRCRLRRAQRRRPALFLADFFAPPFLTAPFLATLFLAAPFFAAPFLAELFLAAFFAPPPDFFAEAFLAPPFVAATFPAPPVLAALFVAAAFLAGAAFLAPPPDVDAAFFAAPPPDRAPDAPAASSKTLPRTTALLPAGGSVVAGCLEAVTGVLAAA